jgi:hypothetical protein
MHGELASPSELKNQIDKLRNNTKNLFWAMGIVITLLIAIGLKTTR